VSVGDGVRVGRDVLLGAGISVRAGVSVSVRRVVGVAEGGTGVSVGAALAVGRSERFAAWNAVALGSAAGRTACVGIDVGVGAAVHAPTMNRIKMNKDWTLSNGRSQRNLIRPFLILVQITLGDS
jgi:hypothetical protein